MLTHAPLIAFVATTDLERSHAFYGGVLGLTVLERSPFANMYDAVGTHLRVTRVGEISHAPYTVLGWAVDDIHASIHALSDRGVSFLRYPGVHQDTAGVWQAPGGAGIAWFQDPDANVLSLTQPADVVVD